MKSSPEPAEHAGSKNTNSGFRATYEIKHGERGRGLIIVPNFDTRPGVDRSIKCVCVVTVESTKHMDIHTTIESWIEKTIPATLVKDHSVGARLDW